MSGPTKCDARGLSTIVFWFVGFSVVPAIIHFTEVDLKGAPRSVKRPALASIVSILHKLRLSTVFGDYGRSRYASRTALGYASYNDFPTSTLIPVARIRSLAPPSLPAVVALSNCATAPRTWRIGVAAGSSSAKD